MAPLPGNRAAVGVTAIAAKTSAMTGVTLTAASGEIVTPREWRRQVAGIVRRLRPAASRNRPAAPWKTWGVGVGTSGLPAADRPAAKPTGDLFADAADETSATVQTDQRTSAPSRSAGSPERAPIGRHRQSAISARSVAAASAEPPPIPDAIGEFFT